MNVILLIGNLGRDPEIRTTNNGSNVASFSIATSERWKDKDGERQEKTTWHNCVVWGPLVKVVESYVHKGSKVAVQGRMEVRKYTNSNNEERTAHEVIVASLELLSPKSDGRDERRGRGREAAAQGAGGSQAQSPRRDDGGYDLDDAIPF